MHHDAVQLELAGPASQRIADVREAYEALTTHALEVLGEAIASVDSYHTNENGHFAWDMALAIRAAALAWRVTGRRAHLAQISRWAKHIAERRDPSLGILDWRGESRPVWSAGARYTSGLASIALPCGTQLRVYATGTSLTIDRPTLTSAVLHITRHDGSIWTLPECQLLPDLDNYLLEYLAPRTGANSVILRGLDPSSRLDEIPAGTYALVPQLAPHLVHTGSIARALICAADVLTIANDFRSDITPDELYDVAASGISVHDPEIRVQAGRVWYFTPPDFPRKPLALELPHNHVVDAATSLVLIGRHQNNGDLEILGKSLTRTFLDEISRYERGELEHPWHYYPVNSAIYRGVRREHFVDEPYVKPIARAEDSAHGLMRVRALADWHTLGPDIVPGTAMDTIAGSFRRFYLTRTGRLPTLRWLPGDAAKAPRRGYSNSFVGAWAAFSPWDSTLRRRLNSLAYRYPPTHAIGATVLSSAEILALNSDISPDVTLEGMRK